MAFCINVCWLITHELLAGGSAGNTFSKLFQAQKGLTAAFGGPPAEDIVGHSRYRPEYAFFGRVDIKQQRRGLLESNQQNGHGFHFAWNLWPEAREEQLGIL